MTIETTTHEQDTPSDEERQSLFTRLREIFPETDYIPHSEAAKRLLDFSLALAENGNTDTLRTVEQIACDGSFRGLSIQRMPQCRLGGNMLEMDYDVRGNLLKIAKDNPDVAEKIVQYGVIGFHGTMSGALMPILEQEGLLSSREVNSRGILQSTGETTTGGAEGESTIRFATWARPASICHYARPNEPTLDAETLMQKADEYSTIAHNISGAPEGFVDPGLAKIAENYTRTAAYMEENPKSLQAKLICENFPIAWGFSSKAYTLYPTMHDVPELHTGAVVERVATDVKGEFAVLDQHIPLDSLPLLAVPHEKIAYVEAILKSYGHDVEVIPLEPIIDNSYSPYDKVF